MDHVVFFVLTGAMQIAVAKEPLKKTPEIVIYIYIFWVLQMHLFLKSKVLVTARLRSLIMDSEGDLGERGSLEIKDRCCCWC